MQDSSTLLLKIFDYAWHKDAWMVLAFVCVVSAILWRIRPNSHKTLRNTLYFLVFGFVGLVLAGIVHVSGYTQSAVIMKSGFTLVIGAGVIRLAGLFLFRVILESLNVRPPSILEEIIVVVAYFVWAMLQLHTAGVPLGEIVTTSAVATAILAFAMRDTLGNILGGLSLEWDQSLKVGDWIRVGETEGKIVDIKWRAISVETRNWETVSIPNSVMMENEFKVLGERIGESVQWRRWIWFNIDFSVSPNRVISIAERAVTEAEIPCMASEPAPNCLLMDIDHSVGRYAMRYWLTDLARDDPTDSIVRQHIYAALNRKQIRLSMPKQHFYLTNKDDTYEQQKQEAEIQHRIAAISHVDLLHSLTAGELANLAERIEYLPYAEDDVIFREGDDDHALYIITDGTVRFSVEGDDGNTRQVVSRGAGDFFGELGLMTGATRSATATADSAMECFRISKEVFTEILQSRESMIEEISQIMASRQSSLQEIRHQAESATGHTKTGHSAGELVVLIKSFFGFGKP